MFNIAFLLLLFCCRLSFVDGIAQKKEGNGNFGVLKSVVCLSSRFRFHALSYAFYCRMCLL